MTIRLTTKSETTTKSTTLQKTTESETTKPTTPRETTAAGKRCADCYQLYQEGFTENGIYEITPSQWSGLPFDVYCKEGWTVIQRRIDGSISFKRSWDDYKEGFGSPDSELWLGNEKLFYLTNQTTYELQIDLIMSDDTTKYLNYDLFRVGDEENNYKLTLGNYNGNSVCCYFSDKDFMGYHNNQFFTTFDRDNDLSADENCAVSHDAGWWFNFCYAANLNGNYFDTGIDGICVVDRNNFQYQCGIQYCEMKTRPLI
ncbi:Angiopoietin-related protein 1 [Holothuria leucospilota]|uniref:Angiopoietin-related protein 1 n=1 Tax=Holothuria leucospilota TaxID=206669 RepID=A0A9Q1H2L4_HOLLE|nr:Angiopoietin-related protein 1 [Holothuria leucospilota]